MIILQKHGAWHQSEFFSSSRFGLFGDLNGGPFLKIGEEDILIVEVNDHSGPCEWNWSKISYVHSNTVGSTLVWHISCT